MKKYIILIIFILIINSYSCTNNVNTINEGRVGDESEIDCNIFKENIDLGEYYEFAVRSEVRGDYKSALKYYTLSLEYSRIWDEHIIQIYSLASLTRIQIYLGLYSLAEETISETIELNNEINNVEITTLIYENEGLLCYYLEDYVNSEIKFLKALKNYISCDVFNSIANLYNNIALVYIKTEHFNEAEKFLIKAINLNKQLNQNKSLSANLTNLGLLKKIQRDFELSEKFYLLALETDKKSNNVEFIGKDLYNLAELYFEYSKIDLALDYYKRTILYTKSLSIPSVEYLYLGLSSCNRIINIAKEKNDKEMEEKYNLIKEYFIEKLKENGEDVKKEGD